MVDFAESTPLAAIRTQYTYRHFSRYHRLCFFRGDINQARRTTRASAVITDENSVAARGSLIPGKASLTGLAGKVSR